MAINQMIISRPNSLHTFSWIDDASSIWSKSDPSANRASLTITHAAHLPSFPVTSEWKNLEVIAHGHLLGFGLPRGFTPFDTPVLRLDSSKGSHILRVENVEKARVRGSDLETIHLVEKRLARTGLAAERIVGILRGSLQVNYETPVPVKLFATNYLGESVGSALNRMNEQEIGSTLDGIIDYIKNMHEAGIYQGHPHPFNFYNVNGVLHIADLARARIASASDDVEELGIRDYDMLFTALRYRFNKKVNVILRRKLREYLGSLTSQQRKFFRETSIGGI